MRSEIEENAIRFQWLAEKVNERVRLLHVAVTNTPAGFTLTEIIDILRLKDYPLNNEEWWTFRKIVKEKLHNAHN